MTLKDRLQSAVERVASKAGGKSPLATALKISRQTVYKWKQIPGAHCKKIEKIYGIPRTELRPDIY